MKSHDPVIFAIRYQISLLRKNPWDTGQAIPLTGDLQRQSRGSVTAKRELTVRGGYQGVMRFSLGYSTIPTTNFSGIIMENNDSFIHSWSFANRLAPAVVATP